METTPKCVLVLTLFALLLLMKGNLSAVFIVVSAECIDNERDALLELKKSFIDEFGCLSSWSGGSCCDWMGVTCNMNGHVVSLTFRHPLLDVNGQCTINNVNQPTGGFIDGGYLRGEINPSLLNLEYLEFLDLSGHLLSGNIPSNIGSLNHLTQLDFSRNNFTGSIPTSIGLLSNLEYLFLSQNDLTGSIPTSIGLLSKLSSLDVSVNSLTGTVSELHFAKLGNLGVLYMNSNKLTMNISHQWVPPFQLQFLNIQSCIVGPKFPSWLQNQRSLTTLNLSSTGISDTIPGWFNRTLSSIEYLDLSKNKIRGKVPEIQAFNLYVMLHSNKFERQFKQFPPQALLLDLSNNLLSGQFPPIYDHSPLDENGPKSFIFANNNLTGPVPEYLCSLEPSIVDLSSNQLSGELNSCFGHSKTLLALDLSNNNLHGQIPSDFGDGSRERMLFSLHLSNNRFHGKLPLTLQNFNNLRTLDLSKNAFTGFLPPWLAKLTDLRIVNLQSNNLYGEIPETLCNFKHLQLLHLGQNNITGIIPPCFNTFTAMTTNDSLSDPINIAKQMYINSGYLFQEYLEVSLRGLNLRYTSSLPFLISMDLSSNKIIGNIPPELTNQLELKNLNLSGNCLQGEIPKRIGNLKSVETLDLSRNKLSGVIPSSLSDISFLSHLNLSFNNLSGRIPTGNQLQTLDDPSIYMGNNHLCGKPLIQKCPGDGNDPSEDGHGEHFGETTHQVEDDDSERLWFYAGLGPGFLVGFLGFCSVLHFCNSWRHAFFLFFENGYNWLVLQIAIKRASVRRKLHKRQTGKPLSHILFLHTTFTHSHTNI